MNTDSKYTSYLSCFSTTAIFNPGAGTNLKAKTTKQANVEYAITGDSARDGVRKVIFEALEDPSDNIESAQHKNGELAELIETDIFYNMPIYFSRTNLFLIGITDF